MRVCAINIKYYIKYMLANRFTPSSGRILLLSIVFIECQDLSVFRMIRGHTGHVKQSDSYVDIQVVHRAGLIYIRLCIFPATYYMVPYVPEIMLNKINYHHTMLANLNSD